MTTDMEQRMPLLPARQAVSQATSVEQSRAVAEVQAAVTVAQACPRNMLTAWAEMRAACGRLGLANRAFYSVPNRGSGPSVHLARELARIWGNLDYGVRELHRDDAGGTSEVLAYAWDQQTNTRSSRSLVVPHARMKTDRQTNVKTREVLFDLGDIYLNNQNIGARAVRETIFTVLPADYVAEAQDLCRATIERGDGEPLDVRIANVVTRFAELGVTVPRIEAKVGRKRGQWTPADLADLSIAYSSIKRRDVDADDEFPGQPVTVDEITTARRPRAAKATPPPAEQTAPAATSRETATTTEPPVDQGQPADPSPADQPGDAYAILEEMLGLFADAEIDGDDRLAYVSDTLGIDVANLAALGNTQRMAVSAALRSYIAQNEPPAGAA